MASKFGAKQIDAKYNTSIDCKNVAKNITKNLIEEYLEITEDKDRIETYCTCQDMLLKANINGVRNFNLKINKTTTVFPCKEWLDLYLFSISMKYLVVFLVPIINVFLTVVLECKLNKYNNSFNIISINYEPNFIKFLIYLIKLRSYIIRKKQVFISVYDFRNVEIFYYANNKHWDYNHLSEYAN